MESLEELHLALLRTQIKEPPPNQMAKYFLHFWDILGPVLFKAIQSMLDEIIDEIILWPHEYSF